MRQLIFSIFICFSFYPVAIAIDGNIYNQSFGQAKNALQNKIYSKLKRETLYCKAQFNGKRIIDPNGFSSRKFQNRTTRVEWDHIVPVENFGRAFNEWRNGHEDCVNDYGVPFKGRECAQKVNKEFRLMLADMYNLYPTIGAVNAIRSNYRFSDSIKGGNKLGSCPASVGKNVFYPSDFAKGKIARASLYMESVYPKYRIGGSSKKLFLSWNKLYPVTKDECERTKAIERLQNNANRFVKMPCIRAGFWN